MGGFGQRVAGKRDRREDEDIVLLVCWTIVLPILPRGGHQVLKTAPTVVEDGDNDEQGEKQWCASGGIDAELDPPRGRGFW